jgi:hypothetical protein
MITRGAGETFNLMVPVRRIIIWAKNNKIEWLLNPKVNVATLEEIEKMPVEDIGYLPQINTTSNSEPKFPPIPTSTHNQEIKDRIFIKK